jgi:hypothetical protein
MRVLRSAWACATCALVRCAAERSGASRHRPVIVPALCSSTGGAILAGVTSLLGIARALNESGVRTPHGGQWYASSAKEPAGAPRRQSPSLRGDLNVALWCAPLVFAGTKNEVSGSQRNTAAASK